MPKAKIIPVSKKRTHRGCAQEIRRLKKSNPSTPNSVIAKAVGCTAGNVTTVLKTFLGNHSPEELQEFQADQPNIVDALKLRTLESISKKKLDKSSASQLAMMFGILYDKGALMRGQPTGINAVVLLDIVEAIKSRQ